LTLAVAVSGQNLEEAYFRSKAAMQLQQYQVAAEAILSVPENKRTKNMLFTLGESYYFSEQYDEAIKVFEAVEQPEAQLYTARIYAMMNRPVQAVEHLKKYLGRREKLFESELQLDSALEKIEHSKEWRMLWEKDWYNASEKKASDAASLLKRKKYTDALAVIDENLARNTSSVRLWTLRAQVYEAMGEDQPALESYRSAIRLRNNADHCLRASAIALRLQKNELALELAQNAIRTDPYRLDAYLQRAEAFRSVKRYDEARKDIRFYFTYLPEDAKALYQMGITETEGGNPLEGAEYLSVLINGDNTRPDYFTARASAYIKAGHYSQANDDLAQALDLNPCSPEIWLKKGIALHQENKSGDACHYWQKAMELGSREAGKYFIKYCGK
jgi:tetratricopeptide (TPR) repeat protein